MGKFRTALLACAALASSAQAREAEPLTLKPSSGWVLDYGENSCALRRGFGEGDQQVFLELDNFALWDTFRVTVMSQGIKRLQRPPRTKFEPETKLRKQEHLLYGTFAEGREGVLYSDSLMSQEQIDQLEDLYRKDLPPTPWDEAERNKRESEITGLYIADTFDQDVRLQTGSLHKPMEAMRTCITDLMAHLGIDPEKTRTLSRIATAKHFGVWVGRFVQRVSTPMHRKGRLALQVRLIVDEQGKAVSCYARDEGQDEEFNKLSCEKLMEVAEFEPALDADGKPVRSVWVTRIYYLF